jgi:hypothetical protein
MIRVYRKPTMIPCKNFDPKKSLLSTFIIFTRSEKSTYKWGNPNFANKTFANWTFANGESPEIYWRKSRWYAGESTVDFRQLARVQVVYWREYSELSPIGESPEILSVV